MITNKLRAKFENIPITKRQHFLPYHSGVSSRHDSYDPLVLRHKCAATGI